MVKHQSLIKEAFANLNSRQIFILSGGSGYCTYIGQCTV